MKEKIDALKNSFVEELKHCNDLKTLNNLSTNNLSIGQALKLPKNTSTTDSIKNISYTVQKGDTLFMGNNE